jgi:hypothetical protein
MQDSHYRTTVLHQELAWVAEFDYQDARLIVSYKTKRALKDQKERQVLLTKIEKSFGKKSRGILPPLLPIAGLRNLSPKMKMPWSL